MNENSSENFIFEVVREITNKNSHIDRDQLYNTLSSIVVKYQIIKLDEDESECNLDHYIDSYLAAKQLDGLSKTTLRGYRIQLNVFSKEIRKNVEEITTAHIRNYLSKYTTLKTSTIATKVSQIKTFFAWLLQEEIIQKDPTKKIKTPRFNKRNPKYLEIDELEMLREACVTLRERALIEVLYASATRLSELCSLNVKDIDFSNFSTTVIGKGNVQRDVFFSLKAIHHLKRYLNSRNDDCEALFVTERKPYRRLTGRGIQRIIDKIASRTSIEKNITPHVLRHTWATLTLNNGADLSVISSILGHSSATVSEIYAHITDENKRYQYKKHLVL